MRGRGPWARWGWLITTLALGAAVIASAWANFRSARRAADDLVKGEAHTLRDVVLATNRPWGEERRANFDSLVAAHRDGGLRYAAWVRTDGDVVWSGGQAAPAQFVVPPSTSDPVFVRLGSRVRAYFPPPHWGGKARPSHGRPDSPDRGTDRSPDRPPSADRSPAPDPAAAPERREPPTIVLEFEPVVAAEMLARAERSLFVAGMVAMVLMAAGIGFWRLSQHIEAGERRMEEQRRPGPRDPEPVGLAQGPRPAPGGAPGGRVRRAPQGRPDR